MSTNNKPPRRTQKDAEQKARKPKSRPGKPGNTGRKSGSTGDDTTSEPIPVSDTNKNIGKGGAKAKDNSLRDPKKNKQRKDKSSDSTPVPPVISGRATLPSGDSVFAGSSFHESPAASSLPQPSFANSPERNARSEGAKPPPPPSSSNSQSMPSANMIPVHNGYSNIHYMPMHMPMAMHSMTMGPMGPMNPMNPMGHMGYPMSAPPGVMVPHGMNPHMNIPMHMMPVYHPGMTNGQYSQPPLQSHHQSSVSPNGAKAAQ